MWMMHAANCVSCAPQWALAGYAFPVYLCVYVDAKLPNYPCIHISSLWIIVCCCRCSKSVSLFPSWSHLFHEILHSAYRWYPKLGSFSVPQQSVSKHGEVHSYCKPAYFIASHGWGVLHCIMYQTFFNRSSVSGQFDSFWVLDIVNHAAVNIEVQLSSLHNIISFADWSVVELAPHRVPLFMDLWGTSRLLSIEGLPVHIVPTL